MKIELTESMPFYMEDTIIGAIVESETVGDLVKSARCLELSVIYTDKSSRRNVFSIHNGGAYDKDEYSRFLKCGELSKIELLTDYYDVSIKADTFESECVINVTEY